MLERRWHVHRLLKKLLYGRQIEEQRGHTYFRHFTEALCHTEITIAIVIIGCVMRTMCLVNVKIPHPLSGVSCFDRKRQSATGKR